MTHAAPRPNADPIGATLLFSLLLHGVLLLGITFHFAKPKPALPTMDVTLVNVANQQAPDHADFLAQANNSGGGNSDRAARPSQPFSGLLPKPDPGTAPRPVEASTPRPQPATAQRIVTTRGNSNFTVDSSSAHPEHDTPDTATADVAQLQQKAAQLAAELNKEREAYAKRPRKKFISANTREYAYATYMRAWVDRIVRVGNLNYPQEARERGLHGDVIVTVALRRDGSIDDIQIIQSSGHAVIDKAVKAIIRLAAPFPPLPHDMKKVDLLYITRTWEFQPDSVLRSQG